MLTVKLDPASGAIASLRRRGIDAELVDGQVNGYLYLPGGNVKDAQPNGPANVTVKEAGPLVASLLVESEAPGCRKLLREVRLVDGLDRVEMIDQVDKLADPHAGGRSLRLPIQRARCAGPREQPAGRRRAGKGPTPGGLQELVLGRALGGRRQRQVRRDLGDGRCAADGDGRSDGPFAPRARRSATSYLERSRPRRNSTRGR